MMRPIGPNTTAAGMVSYVMLGFGFGTMIVWAVPLVIILRVLRGPTVRQAVASALPAA